MRDALPVPVPTHHGGTHVASDEHPAPQRLDVRSDGGRRARAGAVVRPSRYDNWADRHALHQVALRGWIYGV